MRKKSQELIVASHPGIFSEDKIAKDLSKHLSTK